MSSKFQDIELIKIIRCNLTQFLEDFENNSPNDKKKIIKRQVKLLNEQIEKQEHKILSFTSGNFIEYLNKDGTYGSMVLTEYIEKFPKKAEEASLLAYNYKKQLRNIIK